MIEDIEVIEWLEEFEESDLSPMFKKSWLRFSEIQCATAIVVDDESKKRFIKWLSTGDDEDAWS